MKTTTKTIVYAGTKPDRCADDMSIVQSPNRGGRTGWNKGKVACIEAPLAQSGAYARTVRIHELLHAAKTSTRKPAKTVHPCAYNAIEDCYVHAVYWPIKSMPKRANRDCLATALSDVRGLDPICIVNPALWNNALLVSVRALAIIHRLQFVKDKRREVYKKLRAVFGETVFSALMQIVDLVIRNKRKKALALFQSLIQDENDDDDDGQRPKTPTNEAGPKGKGKATAPPMRIVRLPMPEASSSAVRKITLARSGSHIYRPRLVRAVLTGSTAGLFKRARRLPGGSYLFDASGSMGVCASQLEALCNKVPAALIAYYSGRSELPDGCYGELVIYAENGKRAASADRIWGGNEVDLYAIEWLLQQPAPRVYVGDGQFCGGPEGQEVKAEILLRAAVATGAVRWVHSISEANDELSA